MIVSCCVLSLNVLQVDVELFEHLTSLRVSVESFSDIIKKRCIVFDMRVH